MANFKDDLGALLQAQNLEIGDETGENGIPIDTENFRQNESNQTDNNPAVVVDAPAEPTKDVNTNTNEPNTEPNTEQVAAVEEPPRTEGQASTDTPTDKPTDKPTDAPEQRQELTPGEGGFSTPTDEPEVADDTPPKETTGAIEATKEEIKQDAVIQKSIDELLTSASQGKIKSYSEVEQLLNPKDPFANEQLKNINALIQKGETDMDEVLAYYGKDFSALTDAETILKTEMRMSGKYQGWSDEELSLLIDKKYDRASWAEEGEEINASEKLNSKMLTHDANLAKETLVKKQQELTIIKEPTQVEKDQWKADAEKRQRDWNYFVDQELSQKKLKLTTTIDKERKETFAYMYTDAERSGASEIMKSLNANVDNFWNQFKDDEGQLNYEQVYDMLLWNASRNTVLQVAVKNARAEGAEREVMESKNVSIGKKTNDGTPQRVPEPDSQATILAKAKGFI